MKFTTTVAMPCTEEQYIKDNLEKQLISLGYEKGSISEWKKYQTLVLCRVARNETVTINNVRQDWSEVRDADICLTEYNPNLFLALAVMTDNPSGIKGEWWKFTSNDCAFIKGKLYQQENESTRQSGAFRDKYSNINGFSHSTEFPFNKATVEEIQQHFSKTKQTTMSTEILGYKLKKEFHNMQKACKSITGFDFDFKTGMAGNTYVVREKPVTQCFNRLKQANVIDLWFEPVQETFNVGDIVYVINDFENDFTRGCAGQLRKVVQRNPADNPRTMCSVDDGNPYSGTAVFKVRHATKEEIAQFNKKTILTLGSSDIEVKISNGKITADGHEFSLKSLKDTVGYFKEYSTVAYPGYKVKFEGTFKIGCANFSPEELNSIIVEAEKQLS